MGIRGEITSDVVIGFSVVGHDNWFTYGTDDDGYGVIHEEDESGWSMDLPAQCVGTIVPGREARFVTRLPIKGDLHEMRVPVDVVTIRVNNREVWSSIPDDAF